MQNIKNFKITNTTKELLEAYQVPEEITPVFLKSDDGQEWYAVQKLFSDDTIKIQYDSAGVITSVVDKPVEQRGNTYAVSMFFPVNMSVAEISVNDYPEGVSLDGTWKFDGEIVYRDADIVKENTMKKNIALRDKYAIRATLAISAINCSAATGTPRASDADDLLLIQQYVDKLRDVNLLDPVWPEISVEIIK
ncbi:tail fiber assembly protein [Citrobacter sp. S2-9]|uniref:Tail fiber assembly protein n=1 Tax=Citrobacter enshiensis TaxID=2971264 RepID=A0ABT8PRP4_9ENTR|nr:tail fiber assembly protein [Citrobacter enshiensis]MDN8599011.1 tail fiber assembly protein [Citrobacter enshiensis]